jgi:hypothetical protein
MATARSRSCWIPGRCCAWNWSSAALARSPRDQIVTEHRRRANFAVHTGAQRLPPRSVPAGDAQRGNSVGQAEIARRDQVAVVNRQVQHEVVHACPERLPRRAVPCRDVVCVEAPDALERAADDQELRGRPGAVRIPERGSEHHPSTPGYPCPLPGCHDHAQSAGAFGTTTNGVNAMTIPLQRTRREPGAMAFSF